MFAGYPRHLVPYALSEFHSGYWRNGAAAIRKAGLTGLARLAAERSIRPGTQLLHRDLRHRTHPFRHNLGFDDLYRDYLTGYLHCLLHIEDRTSMASSIESRVPLLDDGVIELAVGMHTHWKLRGGVPKRVLRDAVEDLLPPSIIQRKDKRGLPTPFGPWIRGPLKSYARDVLTDPTLKASGVIEMRAVERLFRLHCSGAANLGNLLWRPFSVALWLASLKNQRTTSTSMSLAHAAASLS